MSKATTKNRHIAGINAVNQALDNGVPLLHLYIDEKKQGQRLKALRLRVEKQHLPVTITDKLALDLMAVGSKHQGVVAAIATGDSDTKTLEDILSLDKPLILLLDSLQDPHNLGACLRSAAAANVDAVILPKHRSAGLSPTVSKVACGGAEMLPIFTETNLSRTLEKCQQAGLWALALTGHAQQTLYQADLKQGLVIMLGNEEKGLSQKLLQHADYRVKIPMPGKMESLNVSVAAGVVLFETLRQRGLA